MNLLNSHDYDQLCICIFVYAKRKLQIFRKFVHIPLLQQYKMYRNFITLLLIRKDERIQTTIHHQP